MDFKELKEKLIKTGEGELSFKNGYEMLEFGNYLNTNRIYFLRELTSCKSARYNIVNW